jgi:hypothetical protein
MTCPLPFVQNSVNPVQLRPRIQLFSSGCRRSPYSVTAPGSEGSQEFGESEVGVAEISKPLHSSGLSF